MQTETAVFDTFEFVEALKNAGVPEKQAKEHSKITNKVLSAFQASQLRNIATKSDISDVKKDIKSLQAETKKDIEALRSDLKKDFKIELSTFEAKIGRWGIGVLLAQTALILAVVKFL